MKLVLDTNKLFTFFWKGSLVKKLSLAGHDLYSPKFALEELKKHKSEIIKKSSISSSTFNELLTDLQKAVKFVPLSEYADKISKAFLLLKKHPKDVDFLALALEIEASIVSNDKELSKQSVIDVYNKSKYSELF